jgi:pyridoxine 5-phosphate synthase
MTKLSVNINKVATLRNARGGSYPDVIEFAQKCYEYGAEGITVHPRPDERHIRYEDVRLLAEIFPKLDCEFNIEGYPEEKFIELVLKYKPTQVTLVPDPPHVLTSDSGWDTATQFDFLKPIINRFQAAGIRVSLFMDTDIDLLKKAKDLGVERIEFYTGDYAHQFKENKELAIKNYISAYQYCEKIGLGVNAGHDLNLDNLKYFKENLPNCLEVSIGHYLVSDCLYYGLQNVVPMYKRLLV